MPGSTGIGCSGGDVVAVGHAGVLCVVGSGNDAGIVEVFEVVEMAVIDVVVVSRCRWVRLGHWFGGNY